MRSPILMTVLMVLALLILCAPIYMLRQASSDCEKAGGRVMQTPNGLTCVFPNRGKLV